MNEQNALLTKELNQVMNAPQMSPEALLLEKLRITRDKELPPVEFLFTLFGKPCFPRKELVAITGKAKSGKTFVTSMLMVQCFVKQVLAFKRHTENTESTERTSHLLPLKVLWYDTEQSDQSTQDILRNRIIPMVEAAETFEDDRMDIFNVRSLSWEVRRELLKEAVARSSPDLVIVDGIRDLVNDINDGVLAQEVIEHLMSLAQAHNCCIVCVLHQNKGSEDKNLRGWIGTELMNKAFEVYSCEKLLPKRIFKFEQTLTRKYDIEQPLYFEVNDQGIPQMTVNSPETSPAPSNRTEDFPQLNRDYITHDENDQWHLDTKRLFSDAFGNSEQIGGADLRTAVCQLSNICSFKFYNAILQEAVDSGLIVKSLNSSGHVIYTLEATPF